MYRLWYNVPIAAKQLPSCGGVFYWKKMASSAEIAQQIATYDANKKSSADILNEAMSQYGIPEIRNRVSGIRTTLSNTESALNNVDPSVTGRTSRSLVTEAQRSRIVNKEREPIATQYGQQSRALSDESANLTEQSRAAELLAKGQIDDYTTGRNALQSQYNNTVASEAEQRRREEADRAYQFQKAESDRQYQLSLQQAAKAKSSGSSSSKITPQQAVAQLFSGYSAEKGRANPGYAEQVIKTLQNDYGISQQEAANIVYPYRKAKFGV